MTLRGDPRALLLAGTGDALVAPTGAELAGWKARVPRAQRALTWSERAAARADPDAALRDALARRAREVEGAGGVRRHVQPLRSWYGLTSARGDAAQEPL